MRGVATPGSSPAPALHALSPVVRNEVTRHAFLGLEDPGTPLVTVLSTNPSRTMLR